MAQGLLSLVRPRLHRSFRSRGRHAVPVASFAAAAHGPTRYPVDRRVSTSSVRRRSSVGSQPRSCLSTSAVPDLHSAFDYDYDYEHGPIGDLFQVRTAGTDVGTNGAEPVPYSEWIVGRSASIRRRFAAGDNAQGLLVCGGSNLAKHASFDPNYRRAQDWIRHHAVGPAVVSPVLIGGLVGALVEAALPNSVPIHSSMEQIRPLIVGAEVRAQIEILSAETHKHVNPVGNGNPLSKSSTEGIDSNNTTMKYHETRDGYRVRMNTRVERLQDGAMIATGTHSVWIPYTTDHHDHVVRGTQ